MTAVTHTVQPSFTLWQRLLGARWSGKLEEGIICLYFTQETAFPGCNFILPKPGGSCRWRSSWVLSALSVTFCQLWQLWLNWVRTLSPGTHRATWGRAPLLFLSCVEIAQLQPQLLKSHHFQNWVTKFKLPLEDGPSVGP